MNCAGFSKKGFKLLASAVLAVSLTLPFDAFANPKILVDVSTGKVLMHQDAFQRWYPASLTKLMTTYVTFRALQAGRVTLQTPVVMSKLATSQKPSKMPFKPGDALTLDNALKIMLVKSANDIAMAIAETVGGNQANFVNMMNSEARRIGMADSHFVNPNGLPQAGQYVTARDLALLVTDIRREFPQYAGYFALEGFVIGNHKYTNYNLLIGRFDGADGMKTGFICASGFNQVSSATRGGHTLVSVVLGSDSLGGRADETAEMLQLGFTRKFTTFDTLSSLRPYGANRNQVADVSDEICNPKAHKVRSEGRDDAGRMKLHSPYIHEMDHTPNFVTVSLLPSRDAITADSGSADLNQGDGGPAIRNVPIPRPRPTL
jgi:D-alanyl-D-alanine carboxypeptidase